MLKTLLIACALLAATPALAAKTPSPAEIEKAERAFAADGLTLGIRDSFLKYMADDAIVFRPGPVNAKALYEKRPSSKTPHLEWWPQRIVIARSGDLGLSVGPWAIDGKRGGYYATIWRKGADGQWKWIYDGGAEADAAKGPDPSTRATYGPVVAKGAGSAAAGALAVDDRRGRLKLRPEFMAFTPLGGGASAAGDLAWTYGSIHWNLTDPKPVEAHYMHVWQRRAEGWRLIFETLNTDT
jgi:ketosteroid isomerase-like protein